MNRPTTDNDVINSPTCIVYGNLIVACANAIRKGDTAKSQRIDQAILVMEELYPKETGVWQAYFVSAATASEATEKEAP